MYRFVVGVALAAAWFGAPATVIAKQKTPPAPFSSADVERIAGIADSGCILGPNAKTQTPDEKIANCSTAVTMLEAMAAKAKTPAERAGYAYLIASFDFARAGGYLGVDKVRSRRVCTTAERAFAKIAPVDAALLDTEAAAGMDASRKAMSNSAAACRKDFGTAPGAPALIPQ